MPIRILLVTATSAEAGIITRTAVKDGSGRFVYGNCDIELLVTGVGGISTAWAMNSWFRSNYQPDLAINAGIAGSYRKELIPGTVVIPVSDCFADAGIETAEGFQTLFEAGLENPERFPFTEGRITVANRYVTLALRQMAPVKAVTVSTATGSLVTIDRIVSKFNPDIETMEGATFFYICTGERIPFLALRSVSNLVEPRDRKKWDIPLALNNLSAKLTEFLLMLD